jgi:hypothetical protein
MADKKEEELARINAEMERLLSMPAPFPEKVRPAEMTAKLEHLVRAGSKSRDDDRLGKVIFFLIVAVECLALLFGPAESGRLGTVQSIK